MASAEGAAEKLRKTDAPAAAKLYRAMGFRILNAKKSKYYYLYRAEAR